MGASSTNPMIAPELRFPAHKESWKHLTMREISTINQGLQIPISERLTKEVEGSHFYITNEFLKKGSKKSYYIVNPSPSVVCVESDILMTRTGNTGMVVTGVSGAFHNNFFKISYKNCVSRFFLYYFLTSHRTQHTLLKLAGASTIPDLNHGDFYRIVMGTPTLPEQQKIADFLTAVDERIAQLKQKKALLTDYKKGVMQQLFSQTLRFKDDNGNDFPDWEEKEVKDISNVTSGGTPSRQKASYWNGNIPWVTTSLIDFSQIDSANEYITEEGMKNSAAKIFPKGTILIALYGQGVTRGRVSILGIDATTNQACGAIMVNAQIAHTNFVFYSLQRDYELIRNLSNDGGQKNLSGGLVKSLRIGVPTLLEQIKIANFLTAIDTKIEQVSIQISETQTFKRGLLQQMFI